MRKLLYTEAINEATYQLMQKNKSVFVMGLGVADPSGVFGTTTKVAKKFPKRVIEVPIAENSMTGVALGAAVGGMHPIFTHQRMDFLPMAMDQIVNHLAKWNFIMAGKSNSPVIVRTIIGKAVGGGWGQACQHAQSLQAMFANVPGLNVVMPYSPYDAKGMLISCVRSNRPTIFIEHRSVHKIDGNVPEKMYEVPIGKAKILQKGKDITIVGLSAMNIEINKSIIELNKLGVNAEWIDLRSVVPWDKELILSSVRKTKRLLIADTGHKSFGVSAEIISSIVEHNPGILKNVKRLSLPDLPIPAGPEIEKEYYPEAFDIVNSVLKILKKKPLTNRDKFNKSETVLKFKEVF